MTELEDQSDERDYREDFKDENGNYCHMCPECERVFFGHKRRFLCKECKEKTEAEE